MKYSWAFTFVGLALITGIQSSRLVAADNDTSHSPAFKITLSTENDTVASGKPVQVKVTVTNVSEKRLTLVRNAVRDRGGFDYKFEVRNQEKDSPVPETRLHRAIKGRDDAAFRTSETPVSGSLVFSDMKPGQSITDTVDLSRLYDLAAPGKYVIRARRVDRQSGETVKSTPITITVIH